MSQVYIRNIFKESRLEAGVYRLPFQGQDAKAAFVDPAQGFAAHESFQPFHTKSEFTQGQRPIGRKPSLTPPLQVFGQTILRPVNETQVFRSPAFDGRLDQPGSFTGDKVERFYHHSFAAP